MPFVKSLRDGVLTISDGTTPTANTSTVVLAEGDLSAEETRNVMPILDRGALSDIKSGDQVPIAISFSFKFHGYEVGTGPNPIEALQQRGGASAWVGTRDASTDVYCVDLKWELKGKDGTTEETVTYSDFYWEKLSVKEGDPSMVEASGKAFITAPAIT